RLQAGGKKIEEPRALEQLFVLERATVALTRKQVLDLPHGLVSAVVDLDDDLVDLRPVGIRDALDDVELALFRVDLEEVDALDPMLPDQVRHARHPAFLDP